MFLIVAVYAFFYVLLAYLAAFIHFYAAYVLAFGIVAGLLYLYVNNLLGKRAALATLGLLTTFLLIPTVAVVFEGYTGLIYTMEILMGLCLLMWLSIQPRTRSIIEGFFNPAWEEGVK